MEKNVRLGWLLDRYGAFLTQRQQSLLNLHVNEDLSLAEIAEQEGISRQGVHDALKRGEEQLIAYEARLGILKTEREAVERIKGLEAALEASSLGGQEKASLLEQMKALRQLLEESYGV